MISNSSPANATQKIIRLIPKFGSLTLWHVVHRGVRLSKKDAFSSPIAHVCPRTEAHIPVNNSPSHQSKTRRDGSRSRFLGQSASARSS
jgi:hypothetical protein